MSKNQILNNKDGCLWHVHGIWWVNWLWSSAIWGCWWASSCVAVEANPGLAISAATLACDDRCLAWILMVLLMTGCSPGPSFIISLGWQPPLFSVLVTLAASTEFCHLQRLRMTQYQCCMLSCQACICPWSVLGVASTPSPSGKFTVSSPWHVTTSELLPIYDLLWGQLCPPPMFPPSTESDSAFGQRFIFVQAETSDSDFRVSARSGIIMLCKQT